MIRYLLKENKFVCWHTTILHGNKTTGSIVIQEESRYSISASLQGSPHMQSDFITHPQGKTPGDEADE